MNHPDRVVSDELASSSSSSRISKSRQKGFCVYNKDGSVRKVVDDETEMQEIFAKALTAWEQKKKKAYAIDDDSFLVPKAATSAAAASAVRKVETYEVPLEYQEPPKTSKKRNHSNVSKNDQDTYSATVAGTRRSSRQRSKLGLGGNDKLVSLTYSYGSMEWDAIQGCWRPKKEKKPSKSSSEK